MEPNFLPGFKSASPRPFAPRGFSLIELLTVVAIVVVLAASSMPALNGILSGNSSASAETELSSFIEQTRQYATAHNTYVYVSLMAQTDDAKVPQLAVVAAASNDGTDVCGSGTGFSIGNGAGNARQLDAVMKLKGFVTRLANTVSPTVVPRPDPSHAVNINTGTQTFGPVAGLRYPISFWFAPDGSANVSPVLSTRLEFAIEPYLKNNTTNADAWASVFQISGLTGTVRVYGLK